MPLFDEELGQIMTEWVTQAGALLLGRKTYQIFAASWPLVGDGDPIAATLNSIPKYVASRTLKTVEWNNAHVLTGDIAEEVAKLKEQPGRMVTHAAIVRNDASRLAIGEHDCSHRQHPARLDGGRRAAAAGGARAPA